VSLVIASIDIDAPMQDVWDHIMDPAKMRSWVTIIDRIDRVDPGPIRPGFRMSQTLHLRGVNFKVHWTLEELDAPHYARWEGSGPARAKAITENRLSERNGHTHFNYRNEFRTPFGPLGAAASRVIVGGIPEKEANASLRRLREILEARG
jgi:carbon monoxide dehydrogenase subunit G